MIATSQLENNALKLINCDKLESVKAQVSDLHFDKKIRKLFIGTFLRGIMVYDMNTKSVIRPDYNLKDISITRFKPLNDKELLIATDGGRRSTQNKYGYLSNSTRNCG